MKLRMHLLTILILPALMVLQTPNALGSSEGYEKASKYMMASNGKKHPKKNQKRNVASAKSKKKSQKRKVASTKKKKIAKNKKKSKKKKHKSNS